MRNRQTISRIDASKRGSREGFTFLEVLLALAIAMTFLAALYTSFITLMRTSDQNSARLEALRNARSALMTMTDELKAISGLTGAVPTLIGINLTAPFGNGIDEDADFGVDEEILNGLDDDGDWKQGPDDLHAQVGLTEPIYDRFMYTAKTPFDARYGTDAQDLGDFHVDEDVKFGRDSIIFRIVPTQPLLDVIFRTVTYTIGSFDTENHVLLRQSRTEFTAESGKPALLSTAPLAFGVLGLDFLYWNANGDPNPGNPREARPYWVETWDSNNSSNFDAPGLPLPASIYARVTCFAQRTAEQSYTDGAKVQTLKSETMVNLEQIIGDIVYPRPSI